jgi:hypothetical protein
VQEVVKVHGVSGAGDGVELGEARGGLLVAGVPELLRKAAEGRRRGGREGGLARSVRSADGSARRIEAGRVGDERLISRLQSLEAHRHHTPGQVLEALGIWQEGLGLVVQLPGVGEKRVGIGG